MSYIDPTYVKPGCIGTATVGMNDDELTRQAICGPMVARKPGERGGCISDPGPKRLTPRRKQHRKPWQAGGVT